MLRRRVLALAAAAAMVSGCGPAPVPPLRPAAPPESGIPTGRLDTGWAHQRLREAAIELRGAFAREGSEGMLRLRLRDGELPALFDENAVERIRRLPTGLSPSSGERRWRMFATLAETALVGFCARGARVAEEGGAE